LRYIIALVIPMVLQILAYVVVYFAVIGNGSFIGLLALPAALVAVPLCFAMGYGGARGKRPLTGIVLQTLAVALLPPIGLLILRAIES
jgi:hypothetical protein